MTKILHTLAFGMIGISIAAGINLHVQGALYRDTMRTIEVQGAKFQAEMAKLERMLNGEQP